MPERETKIYTGRPGRPKGVQIVGGKGDPVGERGTKVPGFDKEVTIIDRNSVTPTPDAVITHGEGDTGAPQTPGD